MLQQRSIGRQGPLRPLLAGRGRRRHRVMAVFACCAALAAVLALAVGQLVLPSGPGVDQSPGAPAAAPRDPDWWVPANRDDFDSLDRSVWGVYDGPGNGTTGPRSEQNTFVRDGTLVLRTAPVEGEWRGAGVSSAPGGWTQTYGRYEVRLRFEEGYGVRAVALLWPTSPWPPEVDFFEIPATVAGRQGGILTNHFTGDDGRRRMERLRVSTDFTQWHTVGVEWTPTALTYTLDGEVVGVMTDNVPQEPMWLGLQTAQGRMRDGIVPDESRTPSVDLFVDWVQVDRYVGPLPADPG